MKLRTNLFLSAAFLFTLVLTPVQTLAKTFKTQFISFDLPPNWECKQEEIDWVCQPDNLAERSEVILIVVTKAVNETDDSLAKYEAILKEPKAMRDLLGNSYESKVLGVRTRKIKNQDWVDALQLGSEIPGFYTRYAASVKEKVAGLITYSISESVYAKWSPTMDQLIDTAEVFFDPKAFAEAMNAGPQSLLGSRGASLKGRFAPTFEGDTKKSDEKSGAPMDPTQVGAIIFLLAVVGYVIYKRKNKHG